MIRKVFIAVLFLGVCLELSQARPSLKAKIEDYADALIQGISLFVRRAPCMPVCVMQLLHIYIYSVSTLYTAK